MEWNEVALESFNEMLVYDVVKSCKRNHFFPLVILLPIVVDLRRVAELRFGARWKVERPGADVEAIQAITQCKCIYI